MTGSDVPRRKYVGIDEVGRVLEEIDGVLHIGGLPEGVSNISEMMNCDGQNLDDVFLDSVGYEFRNVDSIGVDMQREIRVESTSLDDDDDDDDDESGGNAVVAEEVVSMYQNSEDVIVGEAAGGLGSSLFRFGSDSSILVEDLNEGASKEPDVLVPEVGMLFELGEEFIAYVHRYAHSAGFGARIYSSDREGGGERRRKPPLMEVIDGVVISGYVDYFRIRMCCRKQGKPKSRSTDPNRSVRSCKTGCNYLVTARRNPQKGNPWRISSIIAMHNHNLKVGFSRFLPRFRTISTADQLLILELNKASVQVSKIYDIFLNKWKGFKKVPFSEIDLHNFIYMANQKRLKDCDFAAMESHFKKMREESPEFYYDFDITEDNRLKSVFWADARCRDAFKYFGDVVCFDTTFVSNRYRMPFAPFVGLNHHGKTMLFGCALISNEDTDSFVWLFETWKKCMGGAPLRILTDQDKAIGKAVQTVFPNTTHRWCLWHVMKNCSKHLGMMENWDEMYNKLQKVLHDSFDVDEFETRWKDWVNEYEVGGTHG